MHALETPCWIFLIKFACIRANARLFVAHPRIDEAREMLGVCLTRSEYLSIQLQAAFVLTDVVKHGLFCRFDATA